MAKAKNEELVRNLTLEPVLRGAGLLHLVDTLGRESMAICRVRLQQGRPHFLAWLKHIFLARLKISLSSPGLGLARLRST